MVDNCGFKNLGTWVVCITLPVQVFRQELRLLQTLIGQYKGSYLREQTSTDRKRVSIDMSVEGLGSTKIPVSWCRWVSALSEKDRRNVGGFSSEKNTD